MTRDQALARLADVIHKGERHPWYDRTVELASLYRKLVTGDGLDELLKKFVKRESDEAFDQRKEITQHVITTVVNNLMDVMRKVPRANYQRILESKDEKTATELESKISGFWGNKSLDDYMKTRWFEMNATDPNAWCVVEFQPFNNATERASPYPYEVSSDQAIDYTFSNNVLKHLVVKTNFQMPSKASPKGVGDKYTVYLADQTFSAAEITKETAIEIGLTGIENGAYRITETEAFFRSGERYFSITFFTPHNAGKVPAIRYGYLRDQWTKGFSFVSPYHSAVPLLKKSIKVNSEMDLTMALSAFPFRIEYAPKCDAPDCFDGTRSDGSGPCQICKGSGHKSVVSAQEKLVLKLPKPGEALWELDKLVVFKSPPVDILQFQKDYVEGLTGACKAAMFNSDIFTKQQVSDTATGKRIDLENVYDTLFDCAIGMASAWKFLVTITAQFAELDADLRSELIFSKDFKLKGMNDLLADLEAANRSEAGPDVKRAIQGDLMRLMFADNPRGLARAQIRDRVNPFSGYSEQQVGLALSDPGVPQKYKTLYLMLGVIFDELEAETLSTGKDFYKVEPAVQRQMVDAKVLSYMELTQQRPVLPANVNR